MMKNTLLALAISSASFGAMAELAPMTDGDLSNATGQSGLAIGITLGSVDKTDLLNVDYSNAGFTMDAFKWEVDASYANDAPTGFAKGETVLLDVDGSTPLAKNPGFIPGDPETVANSQYVNSGTGAPVLSADAVVGHGGIFVSNIQIGGGVDMIIDAVAAGGQSGTQSGLGISFSDSDINIKIGSINTYSQTDGALHSMGSIEMIGMNLDGTTITISGAD